MKADLNLRIYEKASQDFPGQLFWRYPESKIAVYTHEGKFVVRKFSRYLTAKEHKRNKGGGPLKIAGPFKTFKEAQLAYKMMLSTNTEYTL